MDNNVKTNIRDMAMENDRTKAPGEDKPKLNLDMILINEIGQFGLYQFRLIALAAVVSVFVAWATNQFLFTAARISTRCFIPECDDPGSIEFNPSWVLTAIPGTVDNFDNCHRFASTNISTTRDVCPATLFDRASVIPCEEFVYESSNSVVYDFDLACDEWRRSLIGTLRTVGTLFSLPIIGYISDHWGRRTAMVITITIAAVIGVLRLLADTYVGFVISQFFEAFGFGALSCGYIMSPNSFSQASAKATSFGGGHAGPTGPGLPRGIGGPGGPNQGFASHNSGFGGANQGFGNRPGFGSANQGFGSSRPGFGGPSSGFGNNRPGSQGSKGISISIAKSVNIGSGGGSAQSSSLARGK